MVWYIDTHYMRPGRRVCVRKNQCCGQDHLDTDPNLDTDVSPWCPDPTFPFDADPDPVPLHGMGICDLSTTDPPWPPQLSMGQFWASTATEFSLWFGSRSASHFYWLSCGCGSGFPLSRIRLPKMNADPCGFGSATLMQSNNTVCRGWPRQKLTQDE